jgi:hypothetical protein
MFVCVTVRVSVISELIIRFPRNLVLTLSSSSKPGINCYVEARNSEVGATFSPRSCLTRKRKAGRENDCKNFRRVRKILAITFVITAHFSTESLRYNALTNTLRGHGCVYCGTVFLCIKHTSPFPGFV